METIRMQYHGYEIEYFMQPGKDLSNQALTELRGDMNSVAALAGKKFNYGIFDANKSEEEHREFLATANICLIKDEGEAIGFFYNIVLREAGVPIIHAGLVVIAKNRGHNLMAHCYTWMAIIQFRKFGFHYYTNISSTPLILGTFADSVANVWPSYKANQHKPPTKEYVKVLDVLDTQYIQKHFKADNCVIDRKRFVLQSPSVEMGFETNMKKLSRYSKPEANYFCMFWLDYSKGEDLIQIGVIKLSMILGLLALVMFESVKSFFTSAFLHQ